jgi:hypothetical protein
MHTRFWWDNNIRMDLGEKELGGMDWINGVQDSEQCWALVNTL